MDFIVDVQGFKTFNNKFIVKELAIIALQDDAVPMVYHFRAPQKWESLLEEYKSCNRWLELNYHGIPWSSGQIPYEKLESVLFTVLAGAKRVFIKGLEKKKWVSELMMNIIFINLEDINCPALEKVKNNDLSMCSLHSKNIFPMCASQNVRCLQKWLIKKLRSRDECSSSNNDDDGVDTVDSENKNSVDRFSVARSAPYGFYEDTTKKEKFNTMYS